MLLIVSVRAPGMRLPLWLPLPTLLIWPAVWIARLWLRRPLRLGHGKSELLLADAGKALAALAGALLCAGSYRLLAVGVPEEQIRVSVRTI